MNNTASKSQPNKLSNLNRLSVIKKYRTRDLAIPRVLLPHLVLVLLAHLAELPAELHVDLEVEVALVALVGLHAEVAAQLFALLARDVVLEVEDGLLPVRVGRLGGGGEADALVAHAELDVEERHEGLYVVVAFHGHREGGGEGDVRLGHGLDVDLLQQARVAHHLVPVDDVDE